MLPAHVNLILLSATASAGRTRIFWPGCRERGRNRTDFWFVLPAAAVVCGFGNDPVAWLAPQVPNVMEFADWVGRTKQKPIYVTGGEQATSFSCCSATSAAAAAAYAPDGSGCAWAAAPDGVRTTPSAAPACCARLRRPTGMPRPAPRRHRAPRRNHQAPGAAAAQPVLQRAAVHHLPGGALPHGGALWRAALRCGVPWSGVLCQSARLTATARKCCAVPCCAVL